MEEKNNKDTKAKKKGFFGRLADKLDKKMQEKAKSSPCCYSSQSRDNSCCG